MLIKISTFLSHQETRVFAQQRAESGGGRVSRVNFCSRNKFQSLFFLVKFPFPSRSAQHKGEGNDASAAAGLITPSQGTRCREHHLSTRCFLKRIRRTLRDGVCVFKWRRAGNVRAARGGWAPKKMRSPARRRALLKCNQLCD